MTTYRLTEQYLSDAMSLWNPWLTELRPECFVEVSLELTAEKGIGNTDWIRVSTPRGSIQTKALVTRPRAPLHDRRPHRPPRRHAVPLGLPGARHQRRRQRALTALVADPNVSIHEGKAFVWQAEKA